MAQVLLRSFSAPLRPRRRRGRGRNAAAFRPAAQLYRRPPQTPAHPLHGRRRRRPCPDYELLELVLFRAIPRQDVKPLARLLLDTFGDFNRVISASPARLHDGQGRRANRRGAGVEDGRGRRAAHDAGPGHATAGPVTARGRAPGLLPHRHGAPRDGTVPHPLPRPQERADRRRGTGPRHRRPCPGLPARGRQARAGTERQRADPGAQPPLGRPHALGGRHR
jgi:hypothetical protein